MSSREDDLRSAGASGLRGEGAAQVPASERGKLPWSPPKVTTFKVSDTQGIGVGPGEGINNVTNGIA